MAKQNIYDNDSFFENFKNLRNNKINFNDCIETPILLAMIPEVDGKRVLDIGCGMGQHAKQYSDMGAESVLGIDISEKMLEYAKEHFHAKNITYRQMALEDICQIDEQFDLITSSLAFDYAEDLDKLMKNIYGLLKYGAHFVFSMSHPMATAWDGQYDRYTRTESGERLYANMAKNKTEIHVTTVFDGELDATDVFVSLIAQKYSQRNDKEYLVKKQDLGYNKDKVQSDRVPSGLCG